MSVCLRGRGMPKQRGQRLQVGQQFGHLQHCSEPTTSHLRSNGSAAAWFTDSPASPLAASRASLGDARAYQQEEAYWSHNDELQRVPHRPEHVQMQPAWGTLVEALVQTLVISR